MASVPDSSINELIAACARMKRALTLVQCAVLDLHEAFVRRDACRSLALDAQAREHLDRIRRLARPQAD